jgi:hypothetical protein
MVSKVDVEDDKPRTWGGARKGAGRPRARWRRTSPHRRRQPLSARHPAHVTLRTLPHVPALRTRRAYHLARRVLERFLGLRDFRVVHLSIQDDHFHFLVEAANERALSRHMQRLAILLAKAINRELGHRGKVFGQRYHAVHITTAHQARSALSYVLNNWRRHREDCHNGRLLTASIDAYSSAPSFQGWTNRRFKLPSEYVPLPVSQPETWLLRVGWATAGPIDPFERPGRPWW